MRKKRFLLAAICSVAFALTACGGGGNDTPLQSASDLSLDVNPTTGANAVGAVSNSSFTFAGGVPDFGTTGSTTVTLASDSFVQPGAAAAPGFTVASGGQSASGSLTFGSCIFTVTDSTFTSGPLVKGARIVINPCQLRVNAAGLPADSAARSRSIFLILRAAVSAGVPLQVSINGGGQVTINGRILGTVTLQPATGATGGSGG